MANFYERKAEFYKAHAAHLFARRPKADAAGQQASEIEPGLWLGSCDTEADAVFLKAHGITHVLQVR